MWQLLLVTPENLLLDAYSIADESLHPLATTSRPGKVLKSDVLSQWWLVS